MATATRTRGAAAEPPPADVPIQPVDRPILCRPYDEPAAHWVYDTTTGKATRQEGRRAAGYWYKTQRTSGAQLRLAGFAEEERDDLPLVNAIREDVRRWRVADYPNVTRVTRQLLRHWRRPDRARRLFFCQLEAAETVIYLSEILGAGRELWPTQKVRLGDYERLRRGEVLSFVAVDPSAAAQSGRPSVLPRLIDVPNEPGLPALVRYGCKMATGSGKTVVMAMLVAWALCNRGKVPGDTRFPAAALVVCPNLTIKERLQVLRPEHLDNYYAAFDLVPSQLMPELAKGKVLVTNWHAFLPESPHAEGGKSYAVVNKGDESAEAFARRVLDELCDRGPLLVLNDEAHHAYRPAPLPETERISAEERAEREEATVWISGLDRINQACGVRYCIDLSATPFYLHGSGYVEGSPFPWLVSDFGLVDAIESGIVKIPRLPVSDTTGRPEPRYFALWRYITANLAPGEKLPGGKPKPEVVWREAQDALLTLAGQWKERLAQVEAAAPGQVKTPPVMIIVGDNTDIAELFHGRISGEETVEVEPDAEDEEDEEGDAAAQGRGDAGTGRRGRRKTQTRYGTGQVFPGLLSNGPGARRTLRIDSRLLAQAESETPGATRAKAAEELRRIVATVGKLGQPGEQLRCVVSVQMLSEGWDANNVTQILGLRAFGTQLLCEQVVGRGLRRIDYTPDPATGLLTEEYVDIYGVPFSVIPFKGRKTTQAAPEDKRKNHVRAQDTRRHLEMRFPVVEGYAFALQRNLIKADIDAMESLALEPAETPTAVFVKPQVGYQLGEPRFGDGFAFEEHDRAAYYESVHLQTITFEIARQVVAVLTEGARGGKPKLALRSRHQLFPQVYRLVDEYVRGKVDWRGCDPRELGLERYVQRVRERLVAAIEPDEAQGEVPLLPILNRYKPIGSTGEVGFITVRACHGTAKSHIDQVVLDTDRWESSAAFRLEQSPAVAYYARNDHLECAVPYEYQGVPHSYFPDFLVRLTNGVTVLLEIKGYETDEDRAKHEAARRWVRAVNHWGRLGSWAVHVCRDPQLLGQELARLGHSA